jgi:hypothetical protein
MTEADEPSSGNPWTSPSSPLATNHASSAFQSKHETQAESCNNTCLSGQDDPSGRTAAGGKINSQHAHTSRSSMKMNASDEMYVRLGPPRRKMSLHAYAMQAEALHTYMCDLSYPSFGPRRRVLTLCACRSLICRLCLVLCRDHGTHSNVAHVCFKIDWRTSWKASGS